MISRLLLRRAFVLIAASLALWSGASANDGGIAFGGSPGLLKGHPTVSMQSELISITVGEQNVMADCRFVFQNDGPACTVRMGFPDQGEGSEDPDEAAGPDWRGKPAAGTFTSFKSYVDGRPAASKLIRADRPGQFWHTKLVSFPAGGRRIVRDLYTVRGGAQLTRFNSSVHQTSYILHTGSSWHGPIGRTEVRVSFRRRGMSAPLSSIRVTRSQGAAVWERDWSRNHSRVFYRGPARDQVCGMSLIFIRENWRPTPQDDLFLFFDNQKFARSGRALMFGRS
jgi:hypothetical protein